MCFLTDQCERKVREINPPVKEKERNEINYRWAVRIGVDALKGEGDSPLILLRILPLVLLAMHFLYMLAFIGLIAGTLKNTY